MEVGGRGGAARRDRSDHLPRAQLVARRDRGRDVAPDGVQHTALAHDVVVAHEDGARHKVGEDRRHDARADAAHARPGRDRAHLLLRLVRTGAPPREEVKVEALVRRPPRPPAAPPLQRRAKEHAGREPKAEAVGRDGGGEFALPRAHVGLGRRPARPVAPLAQQAELRVEQPVRVQNRGVELRSHTFGRKAEAGDRAADFLPLGRHRRARRRGRLLVRRREVLDCAARRLQLRGALLVVGFTLVEVVAERALDGEAHAVGRQALLFGHRFSTRLRPSNVLR